MGGVLVGYLMMGHQSILTMCQHEGGTFFLMAGSFCTFMQHIISFLHQWFGLSAWLYLNWIPYIVSPLWRLHRGIETIIPCQWIQSLDSRIWQPPWGFWRLLWGWCFTFPSWSNCTGKRWRGGGIVCTPVENMPGQWSIGAEEGVSWGLVTNLIRFHTVLLGYKQQSE